MDSQKYQDFKSIGETQKLSKYADTITISPGFRANCSLEKKQLLLVRQMDFKDNLVMVILDETGKKTIWLRSDYLIIYDDCVVGTIDPFIKSGIITSRCNNQETRAFTNKVKFDESIKIIFDDIPEVLSKYFQKI